MVSGESQPQITTIIPTFQRPKLLQRAIRSVLNQTYPNFRLCIYDNASGDETRSVVEELAKTDARVVYHCHPENIGGLRNFIYGAEHVETPFFSFLSDDDALLPEFYATVLAGVQSCPEAMMSVAATTLVDEEGNLLSVPVAAWAPGVYRPPDGLRAMLRHTPPTWTAVLFRREVVERIGGLDDEVGDAADLDYQYRTAARFPFVVSLDPGALFTLHSSSRSVSGRFDAPWRGWEKVIGNLVNDERIPSDVRGYAASVLGKRLRRNMLHNAVGSMRRGNWAYADEAARLLRDRYHSKAQGYVLLGLSKSLRLFPPAHRASDALNAFRKGIRWRYARAKFRRYLPPKGVLRQR